MREKQKAVVRAFGNACPDTNWAAGDPVGVYMAEALKVAIQSNHSHFLVAFVRLGSHGRRIGAGPADRYFCT